MIVYSVGDVHLSDVAPVGRHDDYAASILNKIREIISLAESEKEGAVVVFVGDLFHRRRFNDYRVMAELVTVLRASRVPCLSIFGNHDWDPRTQTIEGQPINILFKAGALKRLSPEPHVEKFGDVSIEIIGIDYKRELDLEQIQGLQWKGTESAKFLVVHAMIVPVGQTFFGQSHTPEQIKTSANVVLIGHPHWDQHAYQFNGTWFVNFGATSRLYSTDRDRIVQTGRIVVSKNGIEEIAPVALKCPLPPEQVFKRKVEMVKGVPSRPMMVDELVNIGTRVALDVSTLPIPLELKETVDHYLMLAKEEKA